MTWKHRLRDIVLAGGALGVYAGCQSNTEADIGCCNANGDPCCIVDYCGEPMTVECAANKACTASGGTLDSTTDTCIPDAGSGEYDATFKGGSDAAFDDGPDADVDTGLPPQQCCNLNPDPCCAYLHCGGALTEQCAQALCRDAGGLDASTLSCGATDASTDGATDAATDANAPD